MISKYLRVPFLILTCGGVLFVFARLMLASPTVKTYAPSAFAFPESVPLPDWKLQSSESLSSPEPHHSELATQQYQYRQNETTLDIEMRYLKSNGEVKSYIDRYTDIPSDLTVRKMDRGFYGIVAHDETAHLSACIPPRGQSAYTAKQFHKNALLYDIRPQRLMKWWLGQQKLIDQRCLWAHLSTPVEDGSVEDAYDVLEEAWNPWLEWWQSHFPEF